MKDEIANEAGKLARDLDTLSGERIIEHLINAQVTLQKKNTELEAKLDKVLDQLLIMTALVDSDHAAILVLQGQRREGGLVH